MTQPKIPHQPLGKTLWTFNLKVPFHKGVEGGGGGGGLANIDGKCVNDKLIFDSYNTYMKKKSGHDLFVLYYLYCIICIVHTKDSSYVQETKLWKYGWS